MRVIKTGAVILVENQTQLNLLTSFLNYEETRTECPYGDLWVTKCIFVFSNLLFITVIIEYTNFVTSLFKNEKNQACEFK